MKKEVYHTHNAQIFWLYCFKRRIIYYSIVIGQFRLLTVDLKLLSFVLAQRLKMILPKIINEDQIGYIKNKFIGFNLRQIQGIIDYAEAYKIEGPIV